MRPWEIISALRETTKKTEKVEILSTVDEDNEFWIGANLALDPLMVFHIKKMPTPDHYGDGVKWYGFNQLATALSERTITGNIARDTVKAFAEKCTEEQWENWYKLILIKDLKCGVAISTINAAASEQNQIKTFNCQLSININTQRTDKLPTDCFMEAKYDGWRVIWIIPKEGEIRSFTRNGKELFNFGRIANDLYSLQEYPGFPDCGIMLDTEVISESFSKLAQQALRKSSSAFDGTGLAFDTLPLDEFWSRKTDTPLTKRRDVLEQFINFLRHHNPNALVDLSYAEKGINAQTDMDQIMEFFSQQVEAGFEGIMIKDSTLPYNFKKDKTWLKMKPTDTYDVKVVGYKMGKKGSKYEGLLGALLVEGMSSRNLSDDEIELIKIGKMDPPEPVFISSSVGGGLSDKFRKEALDHLDEIIGSIAEVESDSLTKAKDSDHYAFRFSRLKRFRDDK